MKKCNGCSCCLTASTNTASIGKANDVSSTERKTDYYLSRGMAIEEVRESAERLKADFLEQMGVKLNAVINDVVHTIQTADTVDRYKHIASPSTTTTTSTLSSLSTSSLPPASAKNDPASHSHHNNVTFRSSRKQSVSGKLPEKVFVSRPSPLTELLQVTHFKTIHHIFIATLILIMLHNIILDLVEQNTLDLGFVKLMWAFGQPQMTLCILLALEFCGLVVVYPAFHLWSRARHGAKLEWRKLVDYTGALIFLLFLTGMICVPAVIMWNNPLPPASGATITMEQCRLLMKIYAFVRSNVPRVLSNGKGKGNNGACRTSSSSSSSSKKCEGGGSGSLGNSVVRKQRSDKESEEEEEERDFPKVSSSSKSPCSKTTSPRQHGADVGNNGGNQVEEAAEQETLNGGGDGTWASTTTTTVPDFTANSISSSSPSEYELKRRRGRNGEKSSVDTRESSVKTSSVTGAEEQSLKLMSLNGGNCEDNNGATCGTCPSYSKYLYFYLAPTLIYKDSYPRTSFVRWDYVCWNFAQVLGCIVYANFILGRYTTFYFTNFGHPDHPMTVLQFCNAVFSMMLPGILGLVLGFYLLLHSWHNAFAEMLCFGDRLFYKDWWNCSSFHSYYKTWNILVHDWLYTYIFKDAWELGLARHNKAIPTILVFVISSLFHEYVLSFTFNFFFPVLLTLFGGFGLALTFVRNTHSTIGNIFMWFGLISGSGILVSTYTMEFYARINCPVGHEDTTADFFTPRFWTCNAIVWK